MKRKLYRPISITRRIVQLLSFVILIYGGILGLQKIEISWLPFIKPPRQFSQFYRQPSLRGPQYRQVLDTYFPVQACRYVRNIGIFRGCFLHFLSEILSWRTPLHIALPHLLFFLLLALALGRMLCGWVCPLGFLSDILAIIRRRLGYAFIYLSDKLNDKLMFIKYFLVSLIVLTSFFISFPVPWQIKRDLFIIPCQLCPSRLIMPYASGYRIPWDFSSTIITFLFFLNISFMFFFLSGLIIRRAYCRICPLGAILGFFNRGGGISKNKDVSKCTRCGICAQSCPMQNSNVYDEIQHSNVDYSGCIRCFRCIELCPEKNCLDVRFFGIKFLRSWRKGYGNSS